MLGWYSYAEPVGPAWISPRGALSLVWPAIPFVGFAVCLALLIDRRNDRGFYPNEVWIGAPKVAVGVRRESLRLLCWVLTMNVLLFFFQPAILILGRTLFLPPSAYNP
ncbi:hypothetical protein [Mycobacterium sp.]|uniref:hypothetical protein n=1 Tax=Mycobacterium sp. TaxID=1785 RepID=UPI003D0CBA8E